MTQAAQTREKRAPRKRARRADYVRPPDAEPNHPVPHYAYDVRAAVPLRPSIVYAALCSLKPIPLPPTSDGEDRGAVVHRASVTNVTRATVKQMPTMTGSQTAPAGMARRTVGHCLEHLCKKGLIRPWESEARAKHNPDGISYQIVPWIEVMARWAADPEIATAVGTRAAFYVWGKGLWHLKPADVVTWKVDWDKSAADPRAHATLAAMEEPAREVPKPAAPAAPPRRLSVEEKLIEDTAIVHRAILDSGVPAEPEHAAALLAIARQVDAAIPAASVGILIVEMGFGYRQRKEFAEWRRAGGPAPWTVGWYHNDMAAAVHAWRRQRDAAQRATGTRQ